MLPPIVWCVNEICDQHAGRPESAARRLVETPIEKHGSDTVGIATIQQQDVAIAFCDRQVVGRVGLNNRQSFIVGDIELPTQGDDMGIHLNHGQTGLRQVR